MILGPFLDDRPLLEPFTASPRPHLCLKEPLLTFQGSARIRDPQLAVFSYGMKLFFYPLSFQTLLHALIRARRVQTSSRVRGNSPTVPALCR